MPLIETVQHYANIYWLNWYFEMWFLYTCTTVVYWQPCVFIIHRRKKSVSMYVPAVWSCIVFLSVSEMLFNLILTSDTSFSQPNIQYTGWLTLRCKVKICTPPASAFAHFLWVQCFRQGILKFSEYETLLRGLVWKRNVPSGLICETFFFLFKCFCVNDRNKKIMS